MLGLDVHDCARARARRTATRRCAGNGADRRTGLYFQPDDSTVPRSYRGIGVRIEDDIAVTSGTPENLSASLAARKPDDVERWIAELWKT